MLGTGLTKNCSLSGPESRTHMDAKGRGLLPPLQPTGKWVLQQMDRKGSQYVYVYRVLIRKTRPSGKAAMFLGTFMSRGIGVEFSLDFESDGRRVLHL